MKYTLVLLFIAGAGLAHADADVAHGPEHIAVETMRECQNLPAQEREALLGRRIMKWVHTQDDCIGTCDTDTDCDIGSCSCGPDGWCE